MKMLADLPDGRYVSISEHGYFTVFQPVAGGPSTEEWGADFGLVDTGVLVTVNGTVCFDDDRPNIRYDDPDWIDRVRAAIEEMERLDAP